MKTEPVQLFTPSGERLNTDTERIPWDAYPRPCLRRDSFLNLNGWWDFTVTADGESAPEEYDQTIRVPYCPESLLSGIGEVPPANTHLWYRRTFTLPQRFRRDRVLLHIGAADQITIDYGSIIRSFTCFATRGISI